MMKINKKFLAKIIKEELQKELYEYDEELARKVLHVFITFRNFITKHPTKNKIVKPHLDKKIKEIDANLTAEQILDMFNGKVDQQLYNFISNILTQDPNMKAFSNKLDSYEMSITPEEETSYQVYNKKDPDPAWMQPPKSDSAYDQEDTRKSRKNLSMS